MKPGGTIPSQPAQRNAPISIKRGFPAGSPPQRRHDRDQRFFEAAGLNSYDPAEILIYAGHPLRLLKRLKTLIPIGLLLLGVLVDRLSGGLPIFLGKAVAANLRLIWALRSSRPAKPSQPDIVPPVLLEELSRLQDQLPAFPSDQAGPASRKTSAP